MAEMKVGFIDWTPEKAKEVLERTNTHNRPLSMRTVQTYAGFMRFGNWDEHALDPIVINRDGVLENGQHRLSAVVKSGKTVRMWTITGSAPTFGSFDRCRLRSVVDVININGFVEGVSNAHIAVVSFLLTRYGINDGRNDMAIQEYLVDHEAVIKESVRITTKGRGTSKKIARKASVQCAVYEALRIGYSNEELERFTNIVETGFYDDETESSAIVLRNMLLNDIRLNSSSFDKKILTEGITARAISDFHKGKPRKTIYRDASDAFYERVKKMDSAFLEKYGKR